VGGGWEEGEFGGKSEVELQQELKIKLLKRVKNKTLVSGGEREQRNCGGFAKGTGGLNLRTKVRGRDIVKKGASKKGDRGRVN